MTGYERLLVAVDTTVDAQKILRRASDVALRYQADITLIHVVEPMVLDNVYEGLPVIAVDIERTLYERGQQFLRQLRDEFSLHDARLLVEVGSVKGEILRKVEALDIDLLVIGTHGRHGVAMLLGSTANAILHGTECDVLAVRI